LGHRDAGSARMPPIIGLGEDVSSLKKSLQEIRRLFYLTVMPTLQITGIKAYASAIFVESVI
jgi:hypothetical protein